MEDVNIAIDEGSVGKTLGGYQETTTNTEREIEALD
jgi:hypothetical protein